MGFLLLDQPNPNGNHFYPSRRERVLAIVVHGTAGAEDLDTVDDHSAENVAQYAATTDRDVSWHSGSDADSWVDLLPSSVVAWHATDYNGCTVGHEISKRTMDWRNMPRLWGDKTLRMAALGPDGKSGLRQKALELGVPLRWATKTELDHARTTGGAPVGFITHAELQWEDRRDPGYITEGGVVIDTFPRQEFMALLNSPTHVLEDDTMFIRNLETGATAILSGGLMTGVTGDNADATNRAAGGGLMTGVNNVEWNDLVGKSQLIETLGQKLDKIATLVAALAPKTTTS